MSDKYEYLAGAQRAVRAFMTCFSQYRQTVPALPNKNKLYFRLNLVNEEIEELEEAVDTADMPGIADAIGDAIYVLLGMAETLGIDMEPIYSAIHVANMAKTGGPTRPDGKICKPPGWTPPDIEGLLKAQGWKP